MTATDVEETNVYRTVMVRIEKGEGERKGKKRENEKGKREKVQRGDDFLLFYMGSTDWGILGAD